jgi:hypothetical protein
MPSIIGVVKIGTSVITLLLFSFMQNMILTNTCCLTMGYWPMKSNAKIGEISREEYLLPPDSDG